MIQTPSIARGGAVMSETFERDGVRFRYPKDWQIELEEEDESWTISLQGPGTAFLVVSFVPGADDPSELVDAAVAGLKDDYPDLEADDAVDTMAGQPAIGADVHFLHFDLTNTCWVRAVPAAEGAILVLAQCTDEELGVEGEALKTIMSSLAVDE
jgi:hypothetical protein